MRNQINQQTKERLLKSGYSFFFQDFVDLGSVGIDFGEDEDSGGFEYHKLTDKQLKCKYIYLCLHMFRGTMRPTSRCT